jgi:hypothetical protein
MLSATAAFNWGQTRLEFRIGQRTFHDWWLMASMNKIYDGRPQWENGADWMMHSIINLPWEPLFGLYFWRNFRELRNLRASIYRPVPRISFHQPIPITVGTTLATHASGMNSMVGLCVVSAGAGHQAILKGLVMMRILFYKSRKKVKREAFLKSTPRFTPQFRAKTLQTRPKLRSWQT